MSAKKFITKLNNLLIKFSIQEFYKILKITFKIGKQSLEVFERNQEQNTKKRKSIIKKIKYNLLQNKIIYSKSFLFIKF